MKTILTLIALLTLTFQVQAQFQNTNNNTMNTGLSPLMPGEAVATFNNYKPKLQGSILFSENWDKADIVLSTNKVAEDFEVRYDMQNWLLEIKYKGEEYKLHGSNIKRFQLKHTTEYGNTQVLNFINPPLFGKWNEKRYMFLEEIDTKGKYKLYLGRYSIIQKPNYNMVLDSGSKDPIAKMHQDYFIFDGKTFYSIPSNKKAANKIFAEWDKTLPKQIKSKKLSVKKIEDLQVIVEMLNK